MPIKVNIKETSLVCKKDVPLHSAPTFQAGMIWYSSNAFERISQRIHFLEMVSRMNVMKELIPAQGKLSIIIQGGRLMMFGEIEVEKDKNKGYLNAFEDILDELEVLAERYAKAYPRGSTSLVLDYGFLAPHA